jgi:hypothetical protein
MREITGVDPQALPDEILQSTQPVVLRGLVAHWPAVRAGRVSSRSAADYLLRFYGGEPVIAKIAPHDVGGRFFYNADLSGFNFQTVRHQLDQVLLSIETQADAAEPPAIYVGATAVDHWLPGFRAENDLGLGGRKPLVSAWIGNRSRVCAHYDVPDNLACVLAGHRRFTLFPPSEVGSLYIGPLDFHPAGQAISMVDLHHPDYVRFPKFADALKQAQVAELGPGDAIFIPGLWWHDIEALDKFNVLVNYWWRQAPEYMASPISALMLGILSIRDLPPEKRAGWQALFEHYIFAADADTASHIPPAARRVLSPLDATSAAELHAQILKRLGP